MPTEPNTDRSVRVSIIERAARALEPIELSAPGIEVNTARLRPPGIYVIDASWINNPLTRHLLEFHPHCLHVRHDDEITEQVLRLARLFELPVCIERNRLDGDLSLSLHGAEEGAAAETVTTAAGALPDLWRRLARPDDADRPQRIDYALYELGLRDQGELADQYRAPLQFFESGTTALDLACGAGTFVRLLLARGVDAIGVERDDRVVRYVRSLGLPVEHSDAIDYLEQTNRRFDRVFCSHFVEHLPIDVVERLLRGLMRVLSPGGRAVLVFPDPESIRSQLLGFWRDPEHVRFYHPDLIEMMGNAIGLRTFHHSHRERPHPVGPFAATPPLAADVSGTDTGALLARIDALENSVRDLWRANLTWAWNDNACLVFERIR